MTWTAPGSWFGNSNASVTETNQAIGNLLIVEVINFANSTVWATGLTGGGATWVQAGVKYSFTNLVGSAAVFLGTVTTTGSVTITPTWSGTAPASWGIAGREFNSSAGSWVFDKQGNLDVAGTSNANWVSLTPSFGAGELYFGYAENGSSAAAGTTTGYVYNANADTVSNGAAYNLNCPGSATFPVWGAGDGGEQAGIMILVAESSAGVATSGTLRTPFITPGPAGPLRALAAPSSPVPVSGDANVTGVGAAVTVAGGIGTFEGDANVTGVGGAVTVAGGTGTLAGGANVTGTGAQVTVAGGTGTLSGSANVTGAGGAVAVQGGAGTPSGGANVTGVGGAVTVQGGAGTPSGGANVAGTGASISVAAGAGTPAGTGGGAANVTGVAAAITVAGGAGTLSGSANVTGIGALITVTGGIGVPVGGGVQIPGKVTVSNIMVAGVALSNTSTGSVAVTNTVAETVTISQLAATVTVTNSLASRVTIINEVT